MCPTCFPELGSALQLPPPLTRAHMLSAHSPASMGPTLSRGPQGDLSITRMCHQE